MKLVASGPGKSNVFYFTVPRQSPFVAPLPDGIVAIPPSDLPARLLLRLMVQAARIELEMGPSDHTIIGRACEVMMILFIRQQLGFLWLGWAPDAIGYDRQILRAFFNRFQEVFGAPARNSEANTS